MNKEGEIKILRALWSIIYFQAENKNTPMGDEILDYLKKVKTK